MIKDTVAKVLRKRYIKPHILWQIARNEIRLGVENE